MTPKNGMRPVHPGEILRDELQALSMSANALSKALGVPVNRITAILHGQRGVTADTALRLARYFGTTPQLWLNLQQIKQHLKVKRFVGRSKNAVMTQLWVAMCMYLLLAYLKFVMRLRWSLHQMLQVLQLNMFERRPLQDLFTTPSLPAPSGSQLSLAWS